MKIIYVFFIVVLSTSKISANNYESVNIRYLSNYKLTSDKNYYTDIEPINYDGTINIVIEIPTGTNQKWEVSKKTGNIEWEFKKGKPRIIKFLAYPTNYGIIPKTLLSKNSGGDGDPLDVILIGPYVERGSIVKGKLLGILKMLDDGEIDDKLIMVMKDSPLYESNNISDLKNQFPGVLEIIETWFESYKGVGIIKTNGYRTVEEAKKILNKSIKEFEINN